MLTILRKPGIPFQGKMTTPNRTLLMKPLNQQRTTISIPKMLEIPINFTSLTGFALIGMFLDFMVSSRNQWLKAMLKMQEIEK